jgi:D-glycero-D-manno-heptose 1,7-bisphosphate phosphatase
MVDGGTRAVFLDRDGVLVVPEFRDGRSFAPRRLADFRLYDDASATLARLKTAGFRLVVVTNQPDVGDGLVAREIIEEMHGILASALPVDAIEACYHGHADVCDCRKPKPGMLERAARRLGIDCRQSFMIGDRGSDIAAGRAVGCTTILIDLGYQGVDLGAPDHKVSSLSEAAGIILAGV